jgi:hypothetical protein
VATDFSDSVQIAMFYNVIVFAITFLLLFLLPSPAHLDAPLRTSVQIDSPPPATRIGAPQFPDT